MIKTSLHQLRCKDVFLSPNGVFFLCANFRRMSIDVRRNTNDRKTNKSPVKKDSWYRYGKTPSGHIQYKYPSKPGKVTVATYKGDIPPGTLNSILKQAELK